MLPKQNTLPSHIEPYNIHVTAHAVRRYMERNGTGNECELKIAEKLRRGVVYGKEQVFKSKADEVRQLLKHDCLPARYFKDNQLIIVLEGSVIITCHTGEADKWKPKP